MGLSPPRSLALRVAAAITAVAVIAGLALAASDGHARPPLTHRAITATSHRQACSSSARPLSIRAAGSIEHAQRTALDDALTQALRTARSRFHAPAVTGAVVVCGRVVWADATGVLDLASKRPADNGSLFVLNSAAKTFVATMVMQQIQSGHLSLNTTLSHFYPWLPNARQITVRMLLNMTSGLPDYLNNPRIQRMIHNQPRHRWTIDQVLSGLGSGLGAPAFAPGYKYQYSDTNYIVLGGILRQITHRSIEQDFQQSIARPLGITSATWAPTAAARARIAHPYLRYANGALRDQWLPGFGVSSAVWGPVFTDGGLAASSVDVAWFANALLGDRLLSAKAVLQMAHIGRGDYGFGLRDRPFSGHDWLGHRGYFGGFETEDWTDRTRQLTIAVGTNLELPGGPPVSTPIWKAIARAYDRGAVKSLSYVA